jgi:diguanylate cyclase (GGDEF)-like protein
MALTELERTQREARVLAELAALAGSEVDYSATVDAVLRLVKKLVVSPLLCLSIAGIGNHARTAEGTDPDWAGAAARALSDLMDAKVLARAGAGGGAYPIAGPPAWFLAFPAEMRSGRIGALVLGGPEPLAVSADEAQLMLRLAAQAVLVTDRALLLQRVQEQEVTDQLTGVASYRRLLDALEYELARHHYTERRLALMLLDVEGLDRINRVYGRSYGNHILVQLARLVEETVRPIDMVARGGKHDFVVLLPETDADGAQRVCDVVRERFLAMQFAGGAVRLSVGLAHARPDEGHGRYPGGLRSGPLSADALLRRAEGSLQESKQQQREWDALLLNAPAGQPAALRPQGGDPGPGRHGRPAGR